MSSSFLAVCTHVSAASLVLHAGDLPHGFVRTFDGTITTFDPSGAAYTYALAINDKGAVTGSFADGNGEHGYVRRPCSRRRRRAMRYCWGMLNRFWTA